MNDPRCFRLAAFVTDWLEPLQADGGPLAEALADEALHWIALGRQLGYFPPSESAPKPPRDHRHKGWFSHPWPAASAPDTADFARELYDAQDDLTAERRRYLELILFASADEFAAGLEAVSDLVERLDERKLQDPVRHLDATAWCVMGADSILEASARSWPASWRSGVSDILREDPAASRVDLAARARQAFMSAVENASMPGTAGQRAGDRRTRDDPSMDRPNRPPAMPAFPQLDGSAALAVEPEPWIDENVSAAATSPPFVEVLGIPISLTDYERTMDWMDATIVQRGKGYICVAATHTVIAVQDDPELLAAVRGASLVVPNSQPVIWALNALGHDLHSRVYGPELMARYCERSALTGARMFLYGGRNQGALVHLALNLRRRFSGLQIVGGYAPPFRPLTEQEVDVVVAEINHAKPDVVWVGIGVPKQEKWMAALRERIDAPVLVGVGAAFDLHAGLIPQAPSWMHSAGLEWLHRLSKEPRRLWKRYLTYNPRFLLDVARRYILYRARRRRG